MKTSHIVVLAVACAVTLLAAFLSFRSASARDEMRLRHLGNAAAQSIKAELETHAALLQGADGMIRAYGFPTRDAFRDYVQTLDLRREFPAVQGLGVAILARARAGGAIEEDVREAGYTNSIWPAPRGEHSGAIVLIEPQDVRNLAALGFDMLSDETRSAAIWAALSSDRPTISGTVRLVQEIDADVQPGFLMYLGTASGSRRGWVFSPFRAHNFFESALQAMPTSVSARVLDNHGAVLFDMGDSDGRLSPYRVAIREAGWTVEIQPTALFFQNSRQADWLGVLLFGLGGILALAFVFRREAALAHRLEAALARSERVAAMNELLLREVNHRVANSLTLVSSLLSLQQRSLESPEAREALREAGRRISAVARVHSDLYMSQGPQAVSSGRFLVALMEGISSQLPSGREGIRIHTTVDDVEMHPDRAIPLGIVASELVTNAVKYAFPEGAGEIEVSLRREDHHVKLVVCDDGVGMSAAAPPKGSGIGTRIIEGMARQLEAEVTNRPIPRGTCVEFKFAA